MLYYCTSVSLVLFTYIYDFKQNQQKVLEPQRTAVVGNYLCQELFPTSCLPHTPITPGCCGLLCSTQSAVSVAVNTGSPTIVNIIRAEESHRKINKITAN